MMHKIADREGNLTKETSLLDAVLHVLYRHVAGRMLLRPFVAPVFSKLGGLFLDCGLSRLLIGPFIRGNAIDMADYEPKKYTCFNDFFTRRMQPGRRVVDMEAESFVSPCDGRLSVYKIDGSCTFSVKDTVYTAESLLRSRKLAGRYAGGYAWVFRLGVEDYHRYIYTDHARVSAGIRIPGVFHTVKPAAYEHIPVYKENTREYCLLKTENFGTVLQMEVGALLVGRIENRPRKETVHRGEEKGNFAYGGSTIILLTQKKKVRPAGDILRYSAAGVETRVKLGERIGCRGGF